jgi:hypothetical protein
MSTKNEMLISKIFQTLIAQLERQRCACAVSLQYVPSRLSSEQVVVVVVVVQASESVRRVLGCL